MSTKRIATAGNVLVPALLVLESLGFDVAVETVADHQLFRATRGEETYVGEDPIQLLGLTKLIEIRGWEWQATDAEIEETLRRSFDSKLE